MRFHEGGQGGGRDIAEPKRQADFPGFAKTWRIALGSVLRITSVRSWVSKRIRFALKRPSWY